MSVLDDPYVPAVTTVQFEVGLNGWGTAPVRYTITDLDPGNPRAERLFVEVWRNVAPDGHAPIYRRYVGELK